MNKSKVLVQKVNLEDTDLEIAIKFYDKTKENLPLNIKTVLIPHTWNFKIIEENLVYITIDMNISLDVTESFVNKIKESLGDSYAYMTSVCETEIINY